MPSGHRSPHPVIFGIRLEPGISPENFLGVLVMHPEGAARFILEWAIEDDVAATDFLANFLAKVDRELNVSVSKVDSYLRPRPGVKTTFVEERPSVSHVAFYRFCKLLCANQTIVAAVRGHPDYAFVLKNGNLFGEGDFFTDWERKRIGFQYGFGWSLTEFDFVETEPLPAWKKFAIETSHTSHNDITESDRLRWAEQAKARALAEIAETIARQNAVQARVDEEKMRSAQRKAFREQFAALPLLDQIYQLARDDTYSIKVFPVEPDQITLEILRDVDHDTQKQLLGRVAVRWEKSWKQLAKRIQVALED
jgi:hypothetical protein